MRVEDQLGAIVKACGRITVEQCYYDKSRWTMWLGGSGDGGGFHHRERAYEGVLRRISPYATDYMAEYELPPGCVVNNWGIVTGPNLPFIAEATYDWLTKVGLIPEESPCPA